MIGVWALKDHSIASKNNMEIGLSNDTCLTSGIAHQLRRGKGRKVGKIINHETTEEYSQ